MTIITQSKGAFAQHFKGASSIQVGLAESENTFLHGLVMETILTLQCSDNGIVHMCICWLELSAFTDGSWPGLIMVTVGAILT